MRKRKYEKSHPWIRFYADLTKAPAQLWLLLGEASAMCERVALAPVRPAISREMHRVYLAKGVKASTAIEGNTLTEDQVLAQVEGTLSVPPSKEYLKQETENIIDACSTILDQIKSDAIPGLSSDLIKDYNRKVLHRLQLPGGVVPGEISERNVEVGNVYLGAPREDCDYLLERLAEWLNELESKLWPDWAHSTETPMAILKAVLAHLYIAWIHPFGDGNGRTARLVEYLTLAAAGVPSPAAHLLSNHYNETRTEYYRQLDQASKTGGDVFPFLLYAVQGLVDGLAVQLKWVHDEHLTVAWQSYVSEILRDRGAKIGERQRALVMDLSFSKEPVPKAEIVDLSTKLAQLYSGKTLKTVSRDLNQLIDAGLVTRKPDGYQARTGVMFGFMPLRREVDPNA